MNIEEEIARALNRSGWTCEYGSDEPGNYDECEDCRRVCDKQAAALSPLLNRVRAEAWSEGFAAGRNADHNSMWWPKNPYREEANYDR